MLYLLQLIEALLKPMDIHTEEANAEEDAARMGVSIAALMPVAVLNIS